MMRKHLVLIGIVLSVLFLVTATLLYPGGNILDKNAPGFDWSRNFFSNLFLTKALNGETNPARIWALIGMLFNSIAYGLFFIQTALKIPNAHAAWVLRTVGLANMVFTFLIATSLHDIMVTVSSTLTMLGLFYITIFLLRTKLHWLKLFSIVSMLVFYFTLFLYGAGNWGLLAVMQKVSFFCFMFLVLAIEYCTSARDFQRGNPPA